MVDVGSYRFYILGIFVYHALSLFTTLSGSPRHYRFRKVSTDIEGCLHRVPFRDSSERGRVREGEKSRFQGIGLRLENPI